MVLWETVMRRRHAMATVLPKGEKLRQAVKWISGERLEDENKEISLLIQEASYKFDLSPKDEEFLVSFYQEDND
jgi:hypothetical protein